METQLTIMYEDFKRVTCDGYKPILYLAIRHYLMRKWGLKDRTAKFMVRMFITRLFSNY